MSQNQSRTTKTEGHLRKSGRPGSSGANRRFFGNGEVGGGGGTSVPLPALPSSSATPPSLASNQREQGQQSSVPSNSNSDATHQAVLNGVCKTVTSQGSSDGLALKSAKLDIPNNKKMSAAVPKAFAEQFPSNTAGSGSAPFLQFGTINPGIVKGMQVPARTCSAPPNLDEQKSDQVRHDSHKVVPPLPTPSVPKPLQLQPPPQQKQQLVKVGVGQADIRESHPPAHVRRDMMHAPISAAPGTSPARSSVLPAGGIRMHTPFQQQQIPVQFSGPNIQVSQRGVAPTSFQMTMPLSTGNVPQPMFVPMQPQTLLHQGHNLGFVPQFGHQLPPHLNNMGIGIGPPFHSQRRPVKITHPETHEELKLDKRTVSAADSDTSGQRQLPNIIPHSSSLPSFNNQISYYPSPYNHSQMFFPSPSFDPAIGGRPNPLPSSLGLLNVNSDGSPFSVSIGPSSHVTVKPASLLPSERSGTAAVRISMPAMKPESLKPTKLSGDVPIAPQQKQNCEPLISSSSTSSKHSNESEVSSFVHTPVSDAFTAMSEESGSTKEEALIIPESVYDQEESLSITELKISQHKTDIAGSSLSNDSVCEPTADSFSSAINPSKDSIISELETKKDTGGASEPSHASSSISVVEACNVEESTSENTVEGVVSRTFDSSTDRCKALEVEGEHGSPSSECTIDGVCESALSSISPAFTTIGRVDEKTMLVNEEIVNESFVKNNVEPHFACPEEGENHVSAISGTTVVSAAPTTASFDSNCAELVSCDYAAFNNFNDNKVSDHTVNTCEILHSENVSASLPSILLSEMAVTAVTPSSSDVEVKPEITPAKLCNGDQTPPVLSGQAERVPFEPNIKNSKVEDKESYSKDDLTCSSDMVNAYKHLEEKREAVGTSETIEKSTESNSNSLKDLNNVVMAIEHNEQIKAKSEDWEETIFKKRYSRDFLLIFSEKCKDLPDGFVIGPDLTNIMSLSVDTKSGSGNDKVGSVRIIDRPSATSRGDRRMAAIPDGDRWTKSNAPRVDHSHEVTAMNFHPVLGVNNGVLRNPSVPSTNQFPGGIISGPFHYLPSQGALVRNNSDLDRWQRATGTQRGLIAPPQGPTQVMHRSANRYEIGKVSDEEEKKQRLLKAILNKLTPQNFEKLFVQVKEVNIDNVVTLMGVISQIFDKALMEPTFCEMYADFCSHLASELPELIEENEKITFRRLLLNKCQEEFERGEIEQAEADKADEEGEIRQTEDEREEKRIRVRRRMLGNIRLIGELYKKKMLTERIMHECIKKLLGQNHSPDEENVEALCKLMSTIGDMIDHSKAREHMDAYFDAIAKLSTNQKLSSRLRFMLKDTIDLRKNRWRQRRKVEGPKKIEDVHRDAAQERQAQSSKQGRGPIISSRRGAPVDYSHRGSSILSSTNSDPSVSIRGLAGHVRGSSSQDVRLDERHQFESKLLSVPLPHKPTYDGSFSLGPQGGLAKGMSGRGQGLISSIPLVEISPRVGSNCLSSTSTSDRIQTISRNEGMSKHMIGGFSGETNDRTSLQATSGRRPTSSGGKISASSEPKTLSEDILREKSVSAIREFYSAKDEKEIVLCIKDLNTPSFYSSMVSLWVTDSFERKTMDRSLLAQLLVNLTNGPDCLIARAQLIEGFESVLFSLEDAVNDAPRAAEFLGHIFGKLVVESVVELTEIGKMIHEGGEVAGTLVEAGLGSEILGGVLEFVQMEKGDSFLNDVIVSSSLSLVDFKPPNPSSKSKKLNAFL